MAVIRVDLVQCEMNTVCFVLFCECFYLERNTECTHTHTHMYWVYQTFLHQQKSPQLTCLYVVDSSDDIVKCHIFMLEILY